MKMKQARKEFRRQLPHAVSFMVDSGFRTWARLSNLSGTGKLRRIVVGGGR